MGEKVLLFPRDPRGVEWLDREANAYELFNEYPVLPVPRCIERVKDTDISYYEFVVASRLDGTAYSKLEDEVTSENVAGMLHNLAQVIAQWHNISLEKILSAIKAYSSGHEELYHWETQLLEPSTTQEAFEYVHTRILKQAEKHHQLVLKELGSDHVQTLWLECLQEIISLPPVLLHADIHEDQILVEPAESMKIVGILDWETVRVGNPVWEFNFHEWGFGIWKWWKHFSDFRRVMWSTYLERRKMQTKSLEGLDLFYTLSEFLVVLQHEKPLSELIGETRETSVKLYLDRLVDIIRKLVE